MVLDGLYGYMLFGLYALGLLKLLCVQVEEKKLHFAIFSESHSRSCAAHSACCQKRTAYVIMACMSDLYYIYTMSSYAC